MLSIIRLRLIRLRDDYLVFVIMTIMALGLTFVFGMSTGGSYKPTVLIIDGDNSIYSKMFIDELKSNSAFSYDMSEYEEALRKVDDGEVLASIVIKEGFDKSINKGEEPILGIVKIKDSIEIYTIENILINAARKMIGNIKIAETTTNYLSNIDRKIDERELFQYTYNKAVEGWKYKRPVEVHQEIINASKSNGFDNLKHMTIGLSLFFSMYTIVFGIGEILNERKYNTWQRQLVSPISRNAILGGNLIVTLVVGCIQVGILILAGHYLFNVDWGSNIAGIITIAFAFVFSVTCLGLFLSGIVKTHSQLAAITPVILTSTSMLGGCMWPLEIVNSKVLLILANLTPQKWAVQGMEKISMYGSGFEAAITPSLIMLGMGLLFFTMGARLVKFE